MDTKEFAASVVADFGRLSAERVAIERESAVGDILALALTFNGTSDGDAFARVVLARAVEALRRGQAERAAGRGEPLGERDDSCARPELATTEDGAARIGRALWRAAHPDPDV